MNPREHQHDVETIRKFDFKKATAFSNKENTLIEKFYENAYSMIQSIERKRQFNASIDVQAYSAEEVNVAMKQLQTINPQLKSFVSVKDGVVCFCYDPK